MLLAPALPGTFKNMTEMSPGMLSQPQPPAMSVILAVRDRYDTLAKTIQHLRAQTAKDRLEIVIVTPRPDALSLERRDFRMFAGVQVVGLSEMTSLAAAYAAGVRRATAPVVVFGEDHSYPQPDWADCLLREHQQAWAVVGPEVRLANPQYKTSVADFLLGYGEWHGATAAHEVEHLPGHNSSYKRAILLEYGSELENWLEAESVLHWDLRRKGHRLLLQPAAKTVHVCFDYFPSWAKIQFHFGRSFAAFRARNERWPLLRRTMFNLAAPLIPFVRLKRALQRAVDMKPSVIPAMMAGLMMDGLGQLVGCATLRPSKHLMFYELDREKFNNDQRCGTSRGALAAERLPITNARSQGGAN